ncbi:MAG: iron-sulfur cluster assembly accessory protein [Hydrogenophaga sp.]|uniref:HesB/IscA family protein n=1 Tax=Hydrogenophaga sp. TaxID=1904254 RepID=UPI002634C77B|nr:iron-sulfur cluster assembly accessory protein [Hydrogenophaga sp.]MCV0439709.1 iron-sulfur cluster assembly accessory protein [Hydrogenophaga sp.]
MAITLTNKAILELARIMSEQHLGEVRLRVGIKGGGCSGFSYTLGFDDVPPSEVDQVFDYDGIIVVCDPKSFLYLNGVEIDFEESLMGRGFKFSNPNASNSCGCGESFSV